MSKTVFKTVEVEVATYEDEYNCAVDQAASFLDVLVDRGIVMPLTPFMRNQLLTGTQDLRSVLA